MFHSSSNIFPVVYLEFYETMGGKVGPDEDNYDVIPARSTTDLMGSAPALFNEVKEVDYPKGYDKEIKITYISDDPVPIVLYGLPLVICGLYVVLL